MSSSRVGHRERMQGILARLAALALLSGLLFPLRAGSGESLSLPVRFARVDLPGLSPALLSLPGAPVMQSGPVSLGYFTKQGEFVFTGDEPRGFLFGYDPAPAPGAPRGMAVVVEVSTPARASDYMEQYLAVIRDKVEQLNKLENELLLARNQSASTASRIEQLADAALSAGSDDLKAGALDQWCAEVLSSGLDAADFAALPQALQDCATKRAGLKRMYYQSQMARLDLRQSKFELQLVLARLPKPDFSELISLGDEPLVRRNMIEELARIGKGWATRQQDLLSAVSAQERWLERSQGAPSLSSPQPEALTRDATAIFTPPSADPRLVLKRAAVQARVTMDKAELESLGALINMLLNAQAAGRDSGPGTSRGLKRFEIAEAAYTQLMPEALPGSALAEQAASSPALAYRSILDLAEAFVSQRDSIRVNFMPPGSESGVRPGSKGVTVHGDEAAYGLYLVDRCLRGPRLAVPVPPAPKEEEAGLPVNRAVQARPLLDLLEEALSGQREHDGVDLDPGYIKLMAWYAALNPAASRPATRPSATVPN